LTSEQVGWRTAVPGRRGGVARPGSTSRAQNDAKSKTRSERPLSRRKARARSFSVPAQGEASVTTASRPSRDARQSASPVLAAAARAASEKALLANGIPQQRPVSPSG